jgi:prevent-host-death family protein
MDRTMGVTEARTHFAELIDQVHYQGDTVTLLKSGKPAAVLVPVELFARWKAERKTVGDLIRQIQANADPLGEDEAMALALEAQQAVRHAPHR